MGRQSLRLALLAGLMLPAIGCAPLERSLILRPSPFPMGDWQAADIPHEDAFFEAADRTPLHGWFATPPNPREVILYCHGNAGNVTSSDWVLDFYRERLNCAILVFD